MKKYFSRLFLEDIIDDKAHEAATSPKNDLSLPTDEQKKTGNYKKGHINFQGLNIAIENPEGSLRSGVDNNGKKWSQKIHYHYGYIKGTEGKDGDEIDIFLGNNRDSKDVYVVNQKDNDGKFDEVKVMLAFNSIKDALQGYLINYEKGWSNVLSIHQTDIDKFKQWLKSGNNKKHMFTNRI